MGKNFSRTNRFLVGLSLDGDYERNKFRKMTERAKIPFYNDFEKPPNALKRKRH